MEDNLNKTKNVYTLVFENKTDPLYSTQKFTRFFITFVIFGWIFLIFVILSKYIGTKTLGINYCFFKEVVITFFLGICFCFVNFKVFFDFIFRRKFESNTDTMCKFEGKITIEYDFKEPKTKVKYNE